MPTGSIEELKTDIRKMLLEGHNIDGIIPVFMEFIRAREASLMAKVEEMRDSISAVIENQRASEVKFQEALTILQRLILSLEGLSNRKTLEKMIAQGDVDRAVEQLKLPKKLEEKKARRVRQAVTRYERAKDEMKTAASAVSTANSLLSDLIITEAGLRGFRAHSTPT